MAFLEANTNDVKKFSRIHLCDSNSLKVVLMLIDIVAADLSTVAGVQLALEAVKFLELSKDSRVSLLLNTAADPSTMTDSEFTNRFSLEEAITRAASNLHVVHALLMAQNVALTSEVPLTKYTL